MKTGNGPKELGKPTTTVAGKRNHSTAEKSKNLRSPWDLIKIQDLAVVSFLMLEPISSFKKKERVQKRLEVITPQVAKIFTALKRIET